MTMTTNEAIQLQIIPIDLINRNLDQPRKAFELDELEELADSILSEGLMQPITVRPDGEDGYQIVSGERRWRAHCILKHRGETGFDQIACHVRTMDEMTRDIAAIVENLLRVDIAPLEEAHAFGRLVERGMTVDAIAKRSGRSKAKIEQRLQLLVLAPDVAGLLAAKRLDEGHAAEIARLADHDEQRQIVELLRNGKLGAWQSVKNAVDMILSPPAPEPVAPVTAAEISEAEAEAKRKVEALELMERQVANVTALIGDGWSEALCLTANEVSLERCELLADKVQVIRTHIRNMEKMLRNTAAAVVAAEAAAKAKANRATKTKAAKKA